MQTGSSNLAVNDPYAGLPHVVIANVEGGALTGVPINPDGAVPVDQGASLPYIDAVSVYALKEDALYGESASAITDNAAHDLVAAPTTDVDGNPLTFVLVDVFAQNSHATVSTWVNFIEETSGTIRARIYCAALGGGGHRTFPMPRPMGAPQKGLQVQCVTTGANVFAGAGGYSQI